MNSEPRSNPDHTVAPTKTVHSQHALPALLERSQLISVRQVALLLNMSTAHVRRLARSGKLPPPRSFGGRKLSWLATEIEAFIAASPAASQSSK